MKIVLGGGGSAETEADMLAHFASFVRGGRVLNLPWAQLDPSELRLHAWAESTLCRLGVGEVVTMTAISADVGALVDSFDGIFVGGGNTYRLMERLRSTGVAAVLAERARAGFPCYGGSAGAIVLGAHIGTCEHLDRNEVGVTDLAGLNVIAEAVWCHHADQDADRIIQFVRKTGVEVFSLPENAGLRIGQGRVGSLGMGRVSRWTVRGPADVLTWNSA